MDQTQVKLYTPKGRPMRVVGFMSGAGTNLMKIIEHQKKAEAENGSCSYQVTAVFTDNPQSNAEKIAMRFDLPLVVNDIMAFYASRGKSDKKDLSIRVDFDNKTVDLLKDVDLDTVAMAGYMSIITEPILETFKGRMVNVHPGDLRIRKENGERLLTGDYAVGKAIKLGFSHIRATTHMVGKEVDGGEILMLSDPVPVRLPDGVTVEMLRDPKNHELFRKIADRHQDRLKELGDWKIFPKTLELLAEGRYSLIGGAVHLDGEPVVGQAT